MNALENIERTLEELGHNLRGDSHTSGLQPKDVLDSVLNSLEENRVEGLDHKIYAPNIYTVQLYLNDDERSRLLPFLGHEELEAGIQRYCQERKYHFRGPLALEVVDAGPITRQTDYAADLDPRGARPHARPADDPKKAMVISRFDVPATAETELSSQFAAPAPEPIPLTDHDLDRRSPPTYADHRV